MEKIADTLYGILHHPTTTPVVVSVIMMVAVLTLWGAIQGHINERQRDKERAEDIARLVAAREEELASLGVVLPE